MANSISNSNSNLFPIHIEQGLGGIVIMEDINNRRYSVYRKNGDVLSPEEFVNIKTNNFGFWDIVKLYKIKLI